MLKPDVVLFGGQLSASALQQACHDAGESDLFLTVVNLEETPVDELADDTVHADVTDALPALVDALDERERVR